MLSDHGKHLFGMEMQSNMGNLTKLKKYNVNVCDLYTIPWL